MNEKELIEAERKISETLAPNFEVSGNQATRRPTMRVLTETPETREAPEPQLPQRTVSERLAEIHNKIDIVDAKVDLLLAILR